MNGQKEYVIITSIFSPTEAIEKFSELSNYKVVVVGDRKTPEKWNHNNILFLSIAEQQHMGFSIESQMPHNHYCRKMLGYLYAIKHGADVIIDSDDDNIPNNNWCFPSFSGEYSLLGSNLGMVNIYKLFTKKFIWPRGFPLELINSNNNQSRLFSEKVTPCEVGVWQALVNGDPDVDAIFRFLYPGRTYFKNRSPVVLARGTACPFNSQNTAFHKSVFPLLYLPCFVNFRFTDILRGLVAQPIMWKHGLAVGFTKANAIQKRNEHNLLRDFESEVPCYLHSQDVISIVTSAIRSGKNLLQDLLNAYEALEKEKIVNKNELNTLYFWVKDIDKLNKGILRKR